MTTVADCRLVELPRIPRPEGALTPVTGMEDVPFEIQRVYYLYDIPAGAKRGGHAHRELEQLFVCVMGAFTLRLKDGSSERTVELNRGHVAVHVPRLVWRELENFSSGSVCVVLASLPYDEADYIRSWDEYVQMKAAEG